MQFSLFLQTEIKKIQQTYAHTHFLKDAHNSAIVLLKMHKSNMAVKQAANVKLCWLNVFKW